MDKYHIWQQIQCVTFSSEDFLIQACTFFLAWLFNERHKEAQYEIQKLLAGFYH